MHWQLSPAHESRQVAIWGEDCCDDYTAQNGYDLGEGNFPCDDVPIPHPQCLCCQFGVMTKSILQIGKELGDWTLGGDNPELDQWLGGNGENSKHNIAKDFEQVYNKTSNENIAKDIN